MRERRRATKYTEEFKTEALRLLDSTDEPITAVAERLGLNHWTLRGWYRDAVAKKKPSERESKRSIFKHHLLPAFAPMRLDLVRGARSNASRPPRSSAASRRSA